MYYHDILHATDACMIDTYHLQNRTQNSINGIPPIARKQLHALFAVYIVHINVPVAGGCAIAIDLVLASLSIAGHIYTPLKHIYDPIN